MLRFKDMNGKKLRILIGLGALIVITAAYFQVASNNQPHHEPMLSIPESSSSLMTSEKLDLDGDAQVYEIEDGKTDSEDEPNEDHSASRSLSTESYSEPLPDYPDERLNNSSLLGVDTSKPGTPGYGVRDDVEIAIVETFGDNNKATLAALASNAYQQKILELSESGTDKDIFRYLAFRFGELTSCALSYHEQATLQSVGSFQMEDLRDFQQDRQEIWNLQLNNFKRKRAYKNASEGLSSYSLGGDMEGGCENLIQQSYLDIPKNVYTLLEYN